MSTENKIIKKSEIIAQAMRIVNSIAIVAPFDFLKSRKRLEILTLLKERLPATKMELIARLRLVLGCAPHVAKYEIDALKIEQLIKHKNKIYYPTELFEAYLDGLWKKIQVYRAEHPNEEYF